MKFLEFTERLNALMSELDVSSYKLTKATGIANGLISNWRNGKGAPNLDNLGRLADYFGVSTDYLMGRTDVRTMAASGARDDDDETIIVAADLGGLTYNQLPPERQKAISDYVEYQLQKMKEDEERERKRK